MYVLVEWPESQSYIENSECLTCVEIDGAVFVPEEVIKDSRSAEEN